MALRIALFLLIGLGMAGLGVALVTLSHGPPPQIAAAPAAAPAPTSHILVAARSVQGGNLLVPDDVTSKTVPPTEVPENAWLDTPDARAAIRGAMVRHRIAAGAPILHDDVVRPGERGFLAAVLTPGDRAISVGVDAVTGTAGLIWPGDRVDVVLTQKMDDQNAPINKRVSGETVLQDVRVIAVDQHLVEGEAPGNSLNLQNLSQRTVTLEVTPLDARKVAVAATLGRLSLTICSATEPRADKVNLANADGPDPVVWASDVSAAYRTSPTSAANTTIRLFSGTQPKPVEYHY